MKQAMILPILLAVLGLGAGYYFRSATHSPAGDSQGAQSMEDHSPRKSGSRRETSHTVAVKRGLNRSEGDDHWLEWIAGVENATLDDLPRLARMAGDNEAALEIISLRWMKLDPDHLYQTLLKEAQFLADENDDSTFPYHKLSQFLFEAWPDKDPEAAITALSGNSELLGRNGLRMNVMSSVMRNDPRRGLEIMQEWNIRNYGPGTKGITKWAESDPRGAVEAILANAGGFGPEYCMSAVAKVWANNDPQAALDYSRSLTGKLGIHLRDKAFDTWVRKNLDAASEWLSSQNDQRLQDALRPAVIRQWAKDDPQAALTWTKENLTGRYRADAVTELVQGVLSSDKTLAGELVMELEPGPGRVRAAQAVARKLFPSNFGDFGGTADPQAIAWLKGLDDAKAQRAALEAITQGWAASDPDGMMNFFESANGPMGSPQSIAKAARFFSRGDPKGTLEWAERLGPDRSPEVSKEIYRTWINSQPAVATAWLKDLPRDDPRHGAVLKSHLSHVAYLPEAEATERLRALPAVDREQLHKVGISAEKVKRLLEGIGDE